MNAQNRQVFIDRLGHMLRSQADVAYDGQRAALPQAA